MYHIYKNTFLKEIFSVHDSPNESLKEVDNDRYVSDIVVE